MSGTKGLYISAPYAYGYAGVSEGKIGDTPHNHRLIQIIVLGVQNSGALNSNPGVTALRNLSHPS